MRERNWSDFDLVLTQTSVITLGATVAIFADKPHYWWVREFGDLDHELKYPLEARQMGELIKDLSQQVITNSKAVRSHFFGDDPEVIVIEPTPRAVVSEGTDKPKVPHVALVGSLNPGKGGDVFLTALSKLKDSGVSFTASLRGAGDPERVRELGALIEFLGLGDKVLIQSSLTGLRELYSDVSIVVVASKNEAFGRVPFEAANYDCAIVYSRSGGVLEYMQDGVTGLSFNPKDSSELSEKLRRLIADEELMQGLTMRARESLLSEKRRIRILEKLSRTFSPPSTALRFSTLQQAIKSDLTQRDSLLTQRDSLLTSNSWKLTKPLRGISKIFKSKN